MARMPLLAAAAAAAGGRRRLVDLWATAPSAGKWNWQKPLGHDPVVFTPWSSWSRGIKIGVLFWGFWAAVGLIGILIGCGCFCYLRYCRRRNQDDEQHTSSVVPGPLGMHNDDDAGGASAPPPWQLQQQQQQPLPASGDGLSLWSNGGDGEGDRPPRRQRRRRQWQPPAVAEVPAGDVEMAPLGDVLSTPAGVAWALANLAWEPAPDVMSPAADVEMMAPAAVPASGDGRERPSNGGEGEGDRPPRRHRRRRQRQPPAVAELPAGEMEMAPLGDVLSTPAGVAWALANLAWEPEANVLMSPAADMEMAPAAEVDMAPAADMEMAPAVNMEMAPAVDMEMAPAADEEVATAPEPAPTLKCTFSTAEGWTEGTCTVCLSELVDGEKVRVLTACMHCFHATCVEKWLRKNPTCPVCRAAAMAVPARGRRRRRMTEASASLA